MKAQWHASLMMLTATFTLSGCLYYPTTVPVDSKDARCQMVTRELTLEHTTIGNGEPSGHASVGCNRLEECGDGAAVLAAAAVVIPAGSALISGSVVIAGNTLHWMEYQGTCDDSTLRTSASEFVSTLKGIVRDAMPY